MHNEQDIKFMHWAIKLSQKGSGKVSPNPMVGAVVVQDGEIVGRGWHKKAGGPHAEIHALKEAGSRAKGAVLFVTLEPCCHYGKTPPCTDAIVKSGVKKVIIAMKDPNPLVYGKGINKLRRAGVKVEVGLLKDEAQKINESFVKYVRTGMPFVIGKIASSLDGKIATGSGDSKWITNEKARGFVHKLRYEVDAVLVGKNTVLKDDPELTARKNNKIIKRPYRILLDGKLDLPLIKKVFNMKDGKTIVATSRRSDSNKKEKLKKLGVKIIEIPVDDMGRIKLKNLLIKLGKMGITSLLVEGGSEVMASFVKGDFIDKMYYFVAPKFIGNKGISSTGDLGVDKVNDAYTLKDVEVKRFGDNILVTGYPT